LISCGASDLAHIVLGIIEKQEGAAKQSHRAESHCTA
jgi:hypothetical protein